MSECLEHIQIKNSEIKTHIWSKPEITNNKTQQEHQNDLRILTKKNQNVKWWCHPSSAPEEEVMFSLSSHWFPELLWTERWSWLLVTGIYGPSNLWTKSLPVFLRVYRTRGRAAARFDKKVIYFHLLICLIDVPPPASLTAVISLHKQFREVWLTQTRVQGLTCGSYTTGVTRPSPGSSAPFVPRSLIITTPFLTRR